MTDSQRLEVPPVPIRVRVLCPSCVGFGAGAVCDRCGHTGYVLKDPYSLTAGEQGLDELELDSGKAG